MDGLAKTTKSCQASRYSVQDMNPGRRGHRAGNAAHTITVFVSLVL